MEYIIHSKYKTCFSIYSSFGKQTPCTSLVSFYSTFQFISSLILCLHSFCSHLNFFLTNSSFMFPLYSMQTLVQFSTDKTVITSVLFQIINISLSFSYIHLFCSIEIRNIDSQCKWLFPNIHFQKSKSIHSQFQLSSVLLFLVKLFHFHFLCLTFYSTLPVVAITGIDPSYHIAMCL